MNRIFNQIKNELDEYIRLYYQEECLLGEEPKPLMIEGEVVEKGGT